MAEQDNQGTPAGEGSAPPKQMPFKPIASAAPADGQAKPAVVIRRPMLRRPGEGAAPVSPSVTPAAGIAPVSPSVTPAAGIAPVAVPVKKTDTPAGVPVSSADAAKRKTTRVELPEMMGGENAGEFKTVKLRPTPPPHPGGSPLPDGLQPLSQAQIQAAKSKTSRISLEAALGAGENLTDSGAPKTIRLKRPSELSSGATGPIAVPVATAKKMTSVMPAVSATSTVSQQSHTAKLPTQALAGVTPEEGDDNSPTRRKTIKIKRPSAATGIKINVGQGEGGGEGGGEDAGAPGDEDMQKLSLPAGMTPLGGQADTPHWAFLFAAVAALVVTLGVVWILAAQAFGPNAAVTGYTALKGPDIAPPPGLTSLN